MYSSVSTDGTRSVVVILRTQESRRSPELDPGVHRDDASSVIMPCMAFNMHNTL